MTISPRTTSPFVRLGLVHVWVESYSWNWEEAVVNGLGLELRK